MSKSNWLALRPMYIVFIAINLLLLALNSTLQAKGVDVKILAIANLLMLIVALLSFTITIRSLNAKSPHTFVRAIYGSFVAKFFIIAIAAFVYILLAGKSVNKPALLSSMLLYIVYTYLEVSTLLRILKQKKNA